MDNLDEMEKLLKTYNLPRLTHKDRKNLNRSVSLKEIYSVIKNFPQKKIRIHF